MKYIVHFNTHEYSDTSDRPRSAHRVVEANSPEEAREIICEMRHKVEMVGRINKRYIGLIFDAEVKE